MIAPVYQKLFGIVYVGAIHVFVVLEHYYLKQKNKTKQQQAQQQQQQKTENSE